MDGAGIGSVVEAPASGTAIAPLKGYEWLPGEFTPCSWPQLTRAVQQPVGSEEAYEH